MKRLFLLTGVASLAALSLPGSANAEPGILVIPADDVDLVPTATCPVNQGGQSNAGLGCGGVSEPGTIAAYDGDMAALMTAVETAVADFDVYVTGERPPEYVPYMMLMPSTEASEEGISFTCTNTGTNCGALKRNGMGFTTGDTENCMDPDPIHAVLYAFGRMSGLEGVDDVTDVMNYVPDYTMPATAYQDTCNVLVQEFGFNDQDEQIMLPLSCTSRQHVDCDAGGEPAQNSYQDMLARYGARVEDTTAPVFENVTPEDGAELMAGELILGVDMVEDDEFMAARWTISSPALEEAGIEGGTLTKCTNDACADPVSGALLGWADGTLKPTDSDWGATEFMDAPGGEYTITLEASDFHGNVSETLTFTVTVGGGAGADETGGGDDDTAGGDDGADDGADDGGMFTAGATDGGDDGDDGGSGAADGGDDETTGCACTASPESGGLMILLMGLFGLGLRRRE